MSPGDGTAERVMLWQRPPATDPASSAGLGLPVAGRVPCHQGVGQQSRSCGARALPLRHRTPHRAPELGVTEGDSPSRSLSPLSRGERCAKSCATQVRKPCKLLARASRNKLQAATDLWNAAGARRARRGSIEGHQPAGRDGCQLRIRRFCAGRGNRARAKREAGLMLAKRLQARTLK